MSSRQDRFILMSDPRNLVAVACVLVFEIKYKLVRRVIRYCSLYFGKNSCFTYEA